MSRADVFAGYKRLPLALLFILVIAAFALGNIIGIYQIQNIQAQNLLVVDNILTSIEIVSSVARDIDRKWLLVDAYVFERRFRNIEEIKEIEERIAQINRDFEASSKAYGTIATLPGEAAVWQEVVAGIERIEPGIEQALELSRQDRNAEAERKLTELEPHFDEIERKTDMLIEINRSAANSQVVRIAEQQRQTLFLIGLLTLAATGLAVFAAAWVARMLANRDREIMRAATLLYESNRDLDAFAGRVAHDLRGPLSTVNLAAAMLRERTPQEEKTSAILQRSVARMDSLIRDLLAFSRMETQPNAVAAAAEAAAAAGEDLAEIVEAADGVLEIDVEPATVSCSPSLLRQALWNLGENAVKYRPSGVRPVVGIRGRVAGDFYRFQVSDNGPGLPADEAGRVFEPFYRGRGAKSTPGTGLGLSIVKRVVEASGGSVSVDAGAGNGCTFEMSFPLEKRAS